MNPFDELGQRIAREEDSLRARSPGRSWVRERLASAKLPRKPEPWPRARVATGLAAALAVAAAAMFVLRPARHEDPLDVVIGRRGEKGPSGSFIGAREPEPLTLAFSDGTKIDIAPRSRARLSQVDAKG